MLNGTLNASDFGGQLTKKNAYMCGKTAYADQRRKKNAVSLLKYA